MKEAMGSTFLLNLVIVLLAIIGLLMVGFFSYSRAYKAKNKIVDIVEKYDGVTSSNKTAVFNEIDAYLRNVGYNVQAKSCPTRAGASPYSGPNQRYCIYEYSTDKGKYYYVAVYMNINIPLIQSLFVFPIGGETRIIYDL